MANFAKRLCDAQIGATVERVAPQAVLWSPSFRVADGFGVDADLDGSLILQCSWAELRAHGPSTRISRTLVETYTACVALAPWQAAIRFILVGRAPESADRVPLFSVGLLDLQALVQRQGRGTVNAMTLNDLQNQPSLIADRAAAESLDVTLRMWAQRHPPAPHSPAGGPEPPRPSGDYRQGPGFGFHGPSALGVRFPVHRARRTEAHNREARGGAL